MDETSESVKITYTKNLSKVNFSTTLSVPIDGNVNIKTILGVYTYLYDDKVECGSGKALLTGKIGLKVLYIDTDNITNTITDSQSVSESFSDSAITPDTFINISNHNIVNNVLSSDGTLKISCEIVFSPVMYLNIGLKNNNHMFANMITKKSEVQTSTISNVVNACFDYTCNFETKDTISKILCHDAYFAPTTTSVDVDGVLVEGKLYSKLIYETTSGDENLIKELTDIFNIKTQCAVSGLDSDSVPDLSFSLDRSKENISTEIEDDNSIVTILNNIKISGVCIKNISVELIDDAFSTQNEIEINKSTREFNCKCLEEIVTERVSGEITLGDNETAIDDIISCMNIVPEITNSYIKDDKLCFEGIITAHINYIDENKDYKHKQIELPFVVCGKTIVEKLDCTHADIHIVDCRVKAKRGTIIEMEFTIEIEAHVYEKSAQEMIDNVTYGKEFNFSMYDYQIFLGKPNETIWELCKRIKISPDDILNYNKNLPLVMEGGEKIIIKR